MQQILAGIIFIIAYFFIASEKIHKTLVALLGASFMLLFHLISQDKAFEHIDMNVIFLLISMMILVKIIEQTGIFEYVAIKLAKAVKGKPFPLLIVLFILTALFSAFLDNITTVLLIAPISILLAKELKISALPFLISEIFASNIGGTATLIGDPPNIMIGSAAHFSFIDFLFNLAPVILVNVVVISFFFYFIFGKKMHVTRENRARIMDFDEKQLLGDKKLLKNSMIIFSLVLIGFVIHGFVDLEAATIALTGSTLLIILGKIDPDKIFKEVEWTSIFFFIGLFIMVGALVETGIIGKMGNAMIKFTHNDIKFTSKIVIWFSGFFSAIVDNIPFVATMIPLIKDMGTNLGHSQVEPIWWALALGSCLGGNGTLIGASANVIIANFAEKEGEKISFFTFLKYSIPITIITLALSYIYILYKYF